MWMDNQWLLNIWREPPVKEKSNEQKKRSLGKTETMQAAEENYTHKK